MSDRAMNKSDVLCWRGNITNKHIGNKRFRALVIEHQQEYNVVKKEDKAVVGKRIMSLIWEKGGRFLYQGKHGLWTEAGKRDVLKKTLQVLRERLGVSEAGKSCAAHSRKRKSSSSSNNVNTTSGVQTKSQTEKTEFD